MQFNPDPTKPATEVFSHETNKPDHPTSNYNNVPVNRVNETKHLGVTLGSKLNFKSLISDKVLLANKDVAVLKLLSNYVNRDTLCNLCKMNVRCMAIRYTMTNSQNQLIFWKGFNIMSYYQAPTNTAFRPLI